MIYRWLGDGVALLHLAFVLFVVLGGFLVLRWPRLAWLHLPAAAWGALIEFGGWICPLTPLENRLRRAAGGSGYEGGFLERYVFGLLYPEGLTRRHQLVLGVLVLLLNSAIYGYLTWRRRRRAAG